MKKVIAAVVFMLLVAVFAPFGAKRCRRKIFPSSCVTGIII